jgi:SAM-dependent methyltransferase
MINPLDNPDHKANPLRKAITLKHLSRGLPAPVLDIGQSGFSEEMRELLGVEIRNTRHDLDVGTIEGQWGSILCFEVLEHLGNPLHLLLQMRGALAPGGFIWLSTPLIARWRPDSFRAGNHVFEFSRPQLEFLLHRGGLRIAEEYTFRYKPVAAYLRGLRPLVRLFSDRCILLKLEVAPLPEILLP